MLSRSRIRAPNPLHLSQSQSVPPGLALRGREERPALRCSSLEAESSFPSQQNFEISSGSTWVGVLQMRFGACWLRNNERRTHVDGGPLAPARRSQNPNRFSGVSQCSLAAHRDKLAYHVQRLWLAIHDQLCQGGPFLGGPVGPALGRTGMVRSRCAVDSTQVSHYSGKRSISSYSMRVQLI